MKRHASLKHVFAIPFAIALLNLFGLISALTGDGWRDVLSWIGLSVPVAVVGWAKWAWKS